MKRQRGVNGNITVVRPVNPPPNVEDGKKKPKKEGEQKVVVEEDERKGVPRDMPGGIGLLQHGAIMGWNWEDNNHNMPLLGGVVDEQMSWGSTWSPGWDMDYLGGEAFTALYNDVLWDDDIWNLNYQIPIPLQITRARTNLQQH